MCLKIFRKKLALPHPEEPANYAQTMATANIDVVISKWLIDWQVPARYDNHWLDAIEIKLTMEIPYPAATYEVVGKRHLDIRPEWLNAGVIAHEQAHNSYALLTGDEKQEFVALYTPLIKTDPLIKLLYSKNTYGLTSVIEGHAELYRYLGHQLPDVLKPYYPKLF